MTRRPSKAAAAEQEALGRQQAQRDGIIVLMVRGCSRQVAADAVGVHRTTIARWAQSDEVFGTRLAQAEAGFIATQLAGIAESANVNPAFWTARAWLLERRFPELFGQRARLDVTIQARDVAKSVAEETGTSEAEVLEQIEAFLRQHVQGAEQAT